MEVLKGSAFVHGQPAYEHEGTKVTVLESARYSNWHGRFAHFAMFPQLRSHLAAAFAIHEQAAEGRGYDVVEATDWGMLFLPWVTKSDARVVVQLHGSCGQIALHEPVAGQEAEGAFELLLEAAGFAAAPVATTYSHANQTWWAGVAKRDVAYVPPPLALKEPATRGPRSGWVTFGRIQRWKGPQVACAAWDLLGEEGPTLQWHGRDTLHGASGLSTSAWLAREYPRVWGNRILPVGQLAPSAVSAALQGAKAVVIPSEWDVFNLVTAEAMACGCVTVVSSGAGAADLIVEGRNGFVFPAGDERALADAVRRVERMPEDDCRRMGDEAARTVAERLAPHAVAEEKLKLYRASQPPPVGDVAWLQDCLFPPATTGTSFLDGLPLRELLRYVKGRALRKLAGRRS